MVTMSWSDDMRRSHCDGELPLHRKIASGPLCLLAPFETDTREAAIPELRLHTAPSLQEPDSAGLLPLPVTPGTPTAPSVAHVVAPPVAPGVAPGAARAWAGDITPIYPNGAEPKPPASGLALVNGTGASALSQSLLAFSNGTPGNPSQGRDAWRPVTDFWSHAPRDLKLALFAIPVLVGMALHPHLPKVHVTAPAAGAGLDKNFQQVFASQLDAVQRNVANRAAIVLSDDFRSGLEDWRMHGDHAAAWPFDANGFVRPRALALYRPSMGLSDYEMQFLGLIDQRALSFIARAQDFQNYYVVKLVVLKPGPLPTIGVTRYAVINGTAQDRVDTIAPITAMPDTLYRVDLVVHDDTYLLSLQGKVSDSWSEPRLPRGGVGFFSSQGEESRVRWVHVTHQYDMLGRLCAYLAPARIPTANGSR